MKIQLQIDTLECRVGITCIINRYGKVILLFMKMILHTIQFNSYLVLKLLLNTSTLNFF